MARTVDITCDRCGSPIKSGVPMIVIAHDPMPRRFAKRYLDLCTPCTKSFDEWMGVGAAYNPDADNDPLTEPDSVYTDTF
jgi:hypothetical protein